MMIKLILGISFVNYSCQGRFPFTTFPRSTCWNDKGYSVFSFLSFVIELFFTFPQSYRYLGKLTDDTRAAIPPIGKKTLFH